VEDADNVGTLIRLPDDAKPLKDMEQVMTDLGYINPRFIVVHKDNLEE